MQLWGQFKLSYGPPTAKLASSTPPHPSKPEFLTLHPATISIVRLCHWLNPLEFQRASLAYQSESNMSQLFLAPAFWSYWLTFDYWFALGGWILGAFRRWAMERLQLNSRDDAVWSGSLSEALRLRVRLTPCMSKRKSVSDTIVPALLWGGLSLLSGIPSMNARSAFEALPIACDAGDMSKLYKV